jgi:replicative DNA helicase
MSSIDLRTTTAPMPTGLDGLDAILGGGLRRETLTLLAGRVSVGKSMLALQFARAVALRHGKAALIHDLSLSERAVMVRAVAAESSVSAWNLHRGTCTAEELATAHPHRAAISESSLYVDATPSQGIDYIASSIGAMSRLDDEDLALVVVDYAHLLLHGESDETTAQGLEKIGSRLLMLAKARGAAIVLLAPMGWAPEDRVSQRPMLADLGSARCLASIADNVIILDRGDNATMAKIDVVKHRNGPTGSAWVRFEGEYARFADQDESGPGVGSAKHVSAYLGPFLEDLAARSATTATEGEF